MENVLIVENNSRAFAKACIFIHRGKILRIIVFRMTESKDDQKKKQKKGWGFTIMTTKKNKGKKEERHFFVARSRKIATALSIQTLFFRVNFLKTESFFLRL